MIRAALVALLLVAQEPTRFVAYDVFVETDGKPLAAWQFEVAGGGKIVGVEGGEGVYSEPPYYDPRALSEGGRVVVAAFTTGTAPSGRVRVARLHFQETGAPRYDVTLMAAAAPGGARMAPKIKLVRWGENK
jgi:hypothetical protein